MQANKDNSYVELTSTKTGIITAKVGKAKSTKVVFIQGMYGFFGAFHEGYCLTTLLLLN